jgi:hypothetical protein
MDRPSLFGMSIPDKIPQKDDASKQAAVAVISRFKAIQACLSPI